MASLSLGPLKLEGQYLLAPMEAVSDVGFRSLCSSLGASFTFTEMVRGASFARQNKSTLDLVDTYEQGPVGVQLLTKSPDELKKVIEMFFKLRETTEYAHYRNVKAFDLNFGCPNPDLIKIGIGPAMVKRTAKMEALFKTLATTTRAHDDSIAVGAKIRLGLNAREKEYKVAYRLAPVANEHLDFFTVHAKHAGQRGREPADWNALKELRDVVTTKLIGNGGALDAASARAMRQETRVDGVLIARGAIRNPWIFRALSERGAELPSVAEVEAAWKQYRETAQLHGTRQKYLDFHDENFQRMRTALNAAQSADGTGAARKK